MKKNYVTVIGSEFTRATVIETSSNELSRKKISIEKKEYINSITNKITFLCIPNKNYQKEKRNKAYV